MRAGRLLVVLAILALFAIPALAKHHTAEERGKAFFMKADFAGGSTACNACHPDGKGLEQAGSKKSFGIMGGKQNTLEDVVNVCIERANKGTPIAKDSAQMKEIVAYIKTLGKK